jgi:hypothetical protein
MAPYKNCLLPCEELAVLEKTVTAYRARKKPAEIMQRIAAPMIGGMITTPLLPMPVIPAAFLLMCSRREL